jgi:hypothetical protein
MGKGSGNCDRPSLSLDSSSQTVSNEPQEKKSSLSEKELKQDAASYYAGRGGTYDRDDLSANSGLGMDRPHADCIECKDPFGAHDTFHWTEGGPLHGWGEFNARGTCLFETSRINSEVAECVTCHTPIFAREVYQLTEKGPVHGSGRADSCLISDGDSPSEEESQPGQSTLSGFGKFIAGSARALSNGLNQSPPAKGNSFVNVHPKAVNQSLSQRQIVEDEASRKNGKKGTFKSDDKREGGLDRPWARCIECGEKIEPGAAYHWSDEGPIHGWANYNKGETCLFANPPSQKSSHSNQKNFVHCLECEKVIYVGEAYHKVEGGAIHGKGDYKTRQTCLVAHRANLTDALDWIGKEFYQGKISPQQMLEYMSQTAAEEKAVHERVTAGKEKVKQRKGSSSPSFSTQAGFPEGDDTGSFGNTRTPGTSSSQDGLSEEDDIDTRLDDLHDAMDALVDLDPHSTLDEFRLADPEQYVQWHDILEHYDGEKTASEIFEDIQDKALVLEGAMEGLGSASPALSRDEDGSLVIDPSLLDTNDPCYCGSGLRYGDCHELIDTDDEWEDYNGPQTVEEIWEAERAAVYLDD